MPDYLHRSLPTGLAFLAGPQPPDDLCFRSERLQIRWTDSDTPWADPGPHRHRDSDEAYIVLRGAIVLDIEDERVTVTAGEVCFVPAGVFHAVVAVETPIQNLVIRSPAAQDKTYRWPGSEGAMDLPEDDKHVDCSLAGINATYLKRALSGDFAILSGPNPPDTLGFRSSRLQILWSDSNEPWTDPGHHLHTDSDEVYIVLQGAMVLEIEGERRTISTGEACFIPTAVYHAVVGVETPVQALVIRSPASPDKIYRGAL